MKLSKKSVSLLLVAVMMMAVCGSAMAATVTVSSNVLVKDHTFTAFQIFTGTYSETDVLSNVDWGNDINGENFVTALKGEFSGKFTKEANATYSAAEVAEILSTITDTTETEKIAQLAYNNKQGTGTVLVSGENNDLADGYYLIVDTTSAENVGTSGVYNASLLQVVGNINIAAKTSAPGVEKKVKEDDKTVAEPTEGESYGDQYNDVADYDIGEPVPFKLIGTVPDMTRFETYFYEFHDTLSAGLDAPNVNDIKVYAYNIIAENPVADLTAKANIEVNDKNITVTFTDLKAALENVTGAEYIIVEYNSKLNNNAVIGLDGNPNTVKLEYSNKPDESGSGNTNTSETPEDKVIVFTYALNTTKKAANNDSVLPNAEFVLMNETKTKVAKVDTNGFFVEWQDIPTAGADGKIAYNSECILKSNNNGVFVVKGLDDKNSDKHYYLREIKAPDGYNLAANDFEITLQATTNNTQTWDGNKAGDVLTALTVNVRDDKTGATAVPGSVDQNKGTGSITIENSAGSTLPETGGMGTTLLYVGGGILVLAAAILLVLKKRMDVEK